MVSAGRGRGLRERTAQDPPRVRSKDPASDSPGEVGRGGRYTKILTKQTTTKAVAAVIRAAIEAYSHGLADLSSSMEALYHGWRSVPNYSVPARQREGRSSSLPQLIAQRRRFSSLKKLSQPFARLHKKTTVCDEPYSTGKVCIDLDQYRPRKLRTGLFIDR